MASGVPLLELHEVTMFHKGRRGLRWLARGSPTSTADPATQDDRPAVRDVTLEVAAGETLAIVGESGSGKTTIANIAMGLITPTAGRVVFTGNDVTHMSRRDRMRWRRHVQMVFQDPYGSLNPRQSAETAIQESLRNFGIGSKEERAQRVTDLMDEVALPRRCREMYPHELSGGLRQRVSIAAALAPRPDLLVADEPVSALDVSVQAEIVDLLIRIQRETGIGIVFITHDLGVVAEIGHRVAVMARGEIVETGPVEQVFGEPREEYTRSLLDAVLPIDIHTEE